MSNKNLQAQQKAIAERLQEMEMWYLAECPDAAKMKNEPKIVHNEKAVFKGRPAQTWHIEPILPGVNPVLVAFALGDNWVLTLEPMTQKLIGG